MPLSNAQENYIESILEYLFEETPDNATDFSNIFNQANRAFKKQLTSSDSWYSLQECIHQPTHYLRGIERLNPNITIGETQEGILNYITNQLDKLNKEKNNLVIIDDVWNKIDLSTFLSTQDQYKHPYKTTRLDVEGPYQDHPSYLADPDRLFHGYLIPNFDNQTVEMRVTIDVRPEKLENMICLTNIPENLAILPESLDNDEDPLNTFILQQRETALEKAEPLVEEYVVNSLISRGAKRILTYQYYYDLVFRNVISLDLIRQATDTQAKNLTSSILLSRIRSGEYDLSTVLQFSDAERIIYSNPYYYTAIKSGIYSKEQFKGLSEEQGINLTFPPIITLLTHKRVAFDEAKNITLAGKKILTNMFYLESVTRTPHLFSTIAKATPHLKTVLLNETMIDLIMHSKISFASALGVSPNAIWALYTNKFICYLLKHKLMTLLELEIITKEINREKQHYNNLEILETFDRKQLQKIIYLFINLYSNNILHYGDLHILFLNLHSLKEINFSNEPTISPTLGLLSNIDLCTSSYTNVVKRLVAILDQHPKKLMKDDAIDSIEYIIDACMKYSLNFYIVREQALRTCIDMALKDNSTLYEKILEKKDALSLSLPEIYGLYLSIRLFSIYENKPYNNDSILTIQEILIDVSKKHEIPAIVLRVHTIQKLLQQIKNDIAKHYLQDNSNIPVIYKKIYDLIKKAETDARSPENHLQVWPNTFIKIIVAASEERNKPTLPQPANAREGATHHSPRMFGPHNSISTPKEIRLFCQKICAFAELNLSVKKVARLQNLSGKNSSEIHKNTHTISSL
jgi:hypothetical protein